MPATFTGAEIVVHALADLGVDTVFGYPGGAVLPIYDALFAQTRIRHILVRHEAGAVHAAEGYARSTGKPGVVLVTSGPGATNAVTGIADALMDSIPIVVLTGQVPTHLIGTDAFQECDTVGITRHCSKHNYLVKDTAKLGDVIHEAFTSPPPDAPARGRRHSQGRAGGARELHQAGSDQAQDLSAQVKGDLAAIEAAVEMLAAAERPILYTGGGIINAGPGASTLLRELARLSGAPVTSTLMGLGTMPDAHPQFLGMLGMHGSYQANMAMHGCDLMVCIGARFDDRVTGRLDAFSPGSRKIHIDIDRSSINKTVHVDLAIIGDAGHVLEDMLKLWRARGHRAADLSAWWSRIDGWQARDSFGFAQTGADNPAAARDQAALGGDAPLEADHHHRGRPAPDVGGAAFRLRRAEQVADQRRAGDDGLRSPRRDRRANRQPRQSRHRHRRRGEHPDEHSGTRHRHPVPPADQGLRREQRIIWAWSASGRS